jgi:hypothetical protein
MPGTTKIISTFGILLYFSEAMLENKVTLRPGCINSISGTSAMLTVISNLSYPTTFKVID